ncbi:hypothetical protein GCM10027269_21560 [Kribbella endophytica]
MPSDVPRLSIVWDARSRVEPVLHPVAWRSPKATPFTTSLEAKRYQATATVDDYAS